MKRKIIILLLVAGISQASQAQENLQMSLSEAQAYAVEHGFSVQNARLDAEAARRSVKETTSIGLPQVNGKIDFNNFIDIPTQVAPADAFGFPDYLTEFLGGVSQETGVPINAPQGEADEISELQFGAPLTMEAGITATQLIFDGSYFVGLQAAKAYASLTQNAIGKSEAEIKSQTAQAYHTAVMAAENIAILKQSKTLLEKSLNDANAMFENGFAEEQDVDQLRLTLRDVENRINYAQQQSVIALNMLKFTIGLPMDNELSLSDNVETLTSEKVDLTLLSETFNLENNVDYKLQSTSLKMMELNWKNEKARALPSIGAFYSYSKNAQRDEFNFFDGNEKWYPTQLWGVQLKMPIFTSLQGHQRIQKAKIELEQSQLLLNQVSEGAKLEHANAKNDYAFAIDNYQTQIENKELAEKIFNRTQTKYNEGLSSSFDLSQAENQLLSAQGNYINAVLTLLNAKSSLAKALNK